MKTVRYLVPVLGVATICAFAVFAADKKPSTPKEDPVPASDTRTEGFRDALPKSQMRQVLDANPKLVQWLMELTVNGGDLECKSASNALSALAPIAADELIKALDNQNSAVRQTAMTYLAAGAESPGFPLNAALTVLLKIAQNEQEDDAVRKHAIMTVCQIICAKQGAAFPLPVGLANVSMPEKLTTTVGR